MIEFVSKDHQRPLRVGVIGLGVGEKLADQFVEDRRCLLEVICDFSPQKLQEVAGRFPNARTTTDASSILNDPEIDVVAIASYDNYHFEQTLTAIKNDKHVFVEKPFVLDREEAFVISEALKKKKNLRLSSNLILRQSPRFIDLKNRINRGEFGDLYYSEADYNYGRLDKILNGWRGRIKDYSAVYGGGVHVVDLLMWLLGDSIVEVSAVGNKIASSGSGFKNFDMVVSTLRFSNGSIGKMSVNFGCVFPHFHQVSVFGTKATFVNGVESASLYTSRDPSKTPVQLKTPYPGVHKGALISSFIDAVMGVGPALVTENDVFRSMSVCFAIEQSAREGRSIAVRT